MDDSVFLPNGFIFVFTECQYTLDCVYVFETYLSSNIQSHSHELYALQKDSN